MDMCSTVCMYADSTGRSAMAFANFNFRGFNFLKLDPREKKRLYSRCFVGKMFKTQFEQITIHTILFFVEKHSQTIPNKNFMIIMAITIKMLVFY